MMTDMGYVVPMDDQAMSQSEWADTYLYVFDYRSRMSTQPEWMGMANRQEAHRPCTSVCIWYIQPIVDFKCRFENIFGIWIKWLKNGQLSSKMLKLILHHPSKHSVLSFSTKLYAVPFFFVILHIFTWTANTKIHIFDPIIRDRSKTSSGYIKLEELRMVRQR